jgi:Leucine-rich repeat (LRR) protein
MKEVKEDDIALEVIDPNEENSENGDDFLDSDEINNESSAKIEIDTNDNLDVIDFASLTDIKALKLPFKKLTGNLPDTISLLSNLKHLDLSCNNCNGHIPESISCLSKLEILDLYRNEFEGNFS